MMFYLHYVGAVIQRLFLCRTLEAPQLVACRRLLPAPVHRDEVGHRARPLSREGRPEPRAPEHALGLPQPQCQPEVAG